ncbi:MAG: glycosyltransferase family 4 protein [Bacteroidia bacterium]|nr:glycosyltransferase family 4 protein [Bacteroidia bacterium]
MNILFFSHSFGTTTTTFIYNDVVNVNAIPNFEVTCLCLNYENKTNKPFDNVHVVPFIQNEIVTRIKRVLKRHNIYFNLKNNLFKTAAQAIITKVQPHIIHCHFGYEALTLLDNCFDINQQYIIQFHGYDASQKLKSKIYIKRLNYYAQYKNVQFITVSYYMKEALIAVGIKPVNEIKVVYCGVNTDFFMALNNAPNNLPITTPYTFLQVSALVTKKGHRYTLQAFAEFQQRNPTLPAKLIIAGKDFLMGAVQAFAKENNLLHNVEFMGEVNADQIKTLMQQANCFVHHSVTSSENDKEGIPTVIMEAMAMDLPVIATLHAGIPELITDKQNGLLVPEKDIDAYVNAMQAMATGQYSFTPRTSMIDKFSLTNHINTLTQLYKSYEL